MVKTSNFNIELKSVSEEGTFEAILSAYDVIDRVNDRTVKGCFTKTIADMGTRRPLLFSHKQDEPVGSVELIDTELSLNVKGRLNLAVERAREVHSLMLAGDLDAMSIGYAVKDCNYDRDGVRNLTEVELLEASIVAVPANPMCLVTAVKSSDTMTESRFSNLSFLKEMSEEERESAIKEIEDIFAQDQENEKACEDTEEKSEEEQTETPEDDKSEETETDDESEEEQKSFDAIVQQINAITQKLTKVN